MNAGARVKIIMSDELRAIRLEAIVGMCGTITENLTAESRTNKGYMVNLDEKYADEANWFVPESSALGL